jgi:hypothetical protein
VHSWVTWICSHEYPHSQNPSSDPYRFVPTDDPDPRVKNSWVLWVPTSIRQPRVSQVPAGTHVGTHKYIKYQFHCNFIKEAQKCLQLLLDFQTPIPITPCPCLMSFAMKRRPLCSAHLLPRRFRRNDTLFASPTFHQVVEKRPIPRRGRRDKCSDRGVSRRLYLPGVSRHLVTWGK